MNEPIDHHYLPVFYTSRWKGADGQVCRYSKPNGGKVKAKRVSPKGTGFEPRLYETRGLPPERAQAMEKDFMAKLDSAASDALGLLEQGVPDNQWTNPCRTNWSRFLITQMLRSPEDIAQLKASVTQAWEQAMPELEKSYAARRSESDPLTVREYIKQMNPSHADEFAFRIAQNLMHHSKVCELLNNMQWLVLDIPKTGFSLLTSDRPIWRTASLTEDDAFIMMPLGPWKLFTAVVKPQTQTKLKARHKGDLVKAVNRIVVQHAVKYVYGLTDTMLSFVSKYMATRRHSTLLEQVAAVSGQEIVAPDSPLATRDED